MAEITIRMMPKERDEAGAYGVGDDVEIESKGRITMVHEDEMGCTITVETDDLEIEPAAEEAQESEGSEDSGVYQEPNDPYGPPLLAAKWSGKYA